MLCCESSRALLLTANLRDLTVGCSNVSPRPGAIACFRHSPDTQIVLVALFVSPWPSSWIHHRCILANRLHFAASWRLPQEGAATIEVEYTDRVVLIILQDPTATSAQGSLSGSISFWHPSQDQHLMLISLMEPASFGAAAHVHNVC